MSEDITLEVDTLLKQVHQISKHYEEIERKKGENFNIFRILDLQNKELSHSRILRMLLDPKGDHGKGDLFLKYFLNKLLSDKATNICYESVKVYKEYPAKEFGRPDLFIQSKSFGIVIENKIYAGDEDRQIERYEKFLYSKYENKDKYCIIYLTLDGKEPSKDSLGELIKKEDLYENIVFRRSYRHHIVEWLDFCHNESSNHPLLCETIAQYINLIKILTGQTRSKEMDENIRTVLKDNASNIQTALTIYRVLPKLIEELISDNLIEPLKIFLKEFGLEIKKDEKYKIYEQWGGFSFINPNWKSGISLRFEFSGPSYSFRGFCYGIWGNYPKLSELLKYDSDRQDGKHIFLKYIDDDGYNDWVNGKIFEKLTSGNNEVVIKLKEETQKLLELLNEKTKDKDIYL